MVEKVLVRSVDIDALETKVREILQEVDHGEHDNALREAGVTRDPSLSLADQVTLDAESGQGLSPEMWIAVIGAFGPAVAGVAKDAWRIVVVPN